MYSAYLLEGKADAKFSLGDIWNISGRHFTKQRKLTLQANDNCMKAWNHLQKSLDSLLDTKIIRQAHKIMMEDEKSVLVGQYKKSHAFADYHIFAPASHIERYMKDAIFRFHGTKNDDSIMAATNLFGNIINIHPSEDGNGRISRLILAHILIQMKCRLLTWQVKIREVKMFDRKPSMLYIMIVKPFLHCWDNFEQNAGMTLNFKHTHYLLAPFYRST